MESSQPPRLLAGRYRLVEPLGAGGMSVVWRARDEVLGRRVAVKVLAAPYASDVAFRDRIRAEAKAAALLTHPNVTNVYDFGEERAPDGSAEPFVVMELIDGVALSTRLAHGPLPWRTALEVCAETAAALSAAHARGLVHRDVTPANIMITATGVKVVDFGISAVVGERGDGPVVGTPAYLAPERLAGDVGGPAADVYALGMVAYEALTGGLPWPVRTRAEMYEAHRTARPGPLPEIQGLPEQVAALLGRCLAKDPAARPPSAALARSLAMIAGVRVATVDSVDGADPGTPTPAGQDRQVPRVDGPGRTGTRLLVSVLPRDDPEEEPFAEPPPESAERVVPLRWAVAAVVLIGVLAAGSVAVALRGGGAPRTSAGASGVASSAPPSAGPTATPGGTGACIVRYTVSSEWNDGATVEVDITNTGDSAITGWTLEFELTGGLRVGGTWNSAWRQDGDSVTVEAASYNRTLSPGQSLNPKAGANLSGKGRKKERAPTEFRLNGTVCDSRE